MIDLSHMYAAFISYSRADIEHANAIAQVLDSLGVEYFQDVKKLEVGQVLEERVRQALANSSVIVVVISPASVKST